MTTPSGASAVYVGEVASPGEDDWTEVVIDADQQYVAHCLRWQGYAGLRHRITSSADPEAS